MKIVTVVGARPQFIKAAPVSRALQAVGIEEVVVHTGQHYDPSMSAVFFGELGMSEPAYNLGVGSGSHGGQTGRMLVGIEQVVAQEALFYSFSLERHVPADHLLRSIDRFVHLSGIREHLRPFYSDMGRPSGCRMRRARVVSIPRRGPLLSRDAGPDFQSQSKRLT